MRVEQVARLHDGEISFAIFRRFSRQLLSFCRRKFGFQFLCDFLRQVGLNRENVCQIAIVILRPKVLVALGIDQLHVHPHAIVFRVGTDAAFQNGRDAERLTDFPHARCSSAVAHDRSARNHLQIADFCQIGQNVILNAVSKKRVLLVIA